MTDHDEMQARVLSALERYERERMKPKHLNYWSKIKRCGVRLPMRKPTMTKALRVWCVDDDKVLI